MGTRKKKGTNVKSQKKCLQCNQSMLLEKEKKTPKFIISTYKCNLCNITSILETERINLQ